MSVVAGHVAIPEPRSREHFRRYRKGRKPILLPPCPVDDCKQHVRLRCKICYLGVCWWHLDDHYATLHPGPCVFDGLVAA